ncbi:substrate-binding domain-containing protein [Desulfocurvus vexinensis]|uniref:substrate-binding domain-containing protein n=1 Tax=Desulfocurvus vexinensis TaxID=399548 RepID=UPI00146FC13A|nr:substrate-binding domain-containing protein [Desulfocurvus vexinensis]
MILPLLTLALFLGLYPVAGVCQERVVLAGTGDGQEVFEHLAKAYMRAYPERVVELPPTVGSSGGVRCAAAGTCDLARLARPLRDKELRFQLAYAPLARVPVVFASHPGVTVSRLSRAQAVGVLTGGLTNWRALGGPDHRIFVVQRESTEAPHAALAGYLTELAGQALVGKVAYDADEALAAITGNEFTFGFVSLTAARARGLNILWIDGLEPGPDGALRPDYPMMMTHGLAWLPEPSSAARRFLDFALGPEGRAALADLGVLPVVP